MGHQHIQELFPQHGVFDARAAAVVQLQFGAVEVRLQPQIIHGGEFGELRFEQYGLKNDDAVDNLRSGRAGCNAHGVYAA